MDTDDVLYDVLSCAYYELMTCLDFSPLKTRTCMDVGTLQFRDYFVGIALINRHAIHCTRSHHESTINRHAINGTQAAELQLPWHIVTLRAAVGAKKKLLGHSKASFEFPS